MASLGLSALEQCGHGRERFRLRHLTPLAVRIRSGRRPETVPIISRLQVEMHVRLAMEYSRSKPVQWALYSHRADLVIAQPARTFYSDTDEDTCWSRQPCRP